MFLIRYRAEHLRVYICDRNVHAVCEYFGVVFIIYNIVCFVATRQYDTVFVLGVCRVAACTELFHPLLLIWPKTLHRQTGNF